MIVVLHVKTYFMVICVSLAVQSSDYWQPLLSIVLLQFPFPVPIPIPPGILFPALQLPPMEWWKSILF